MRGDLFIVNVFFFFRYYNYAALSASNVTITISCAIVFGNDEAQMLGLADQQNNRKARNTHINVYRSTKKHPNLTVVATEDDYYRMHTFVNF